MTASDKVENSFVRQRLPWLIGAGGLLVYLITLNHWISLSSLGTVARTAGWLWQPEVGRPLTLALFFPFRLLPDSWLPLALNLFTAALAGLVLVQLARSVTLLRYQVASDDPFHQGKPISSLLASPAAWMPPVLAALACGLQLTFWENATSATGEMISLLCFAYALRCLLEFRTTGNQSWLSRCVCVYAAGMADNWLLLGYAPVLLATVVWIKGFGPFLKPHFLLRLTAWGLVGLSFYLLVPMLLRLSPDQPADFSTTLTAHLRLQKQLLFIFRNPDLRMLVLAALLPAAFLAVRWRSHAVQFADDTQLGVVLIRAAGHSAHALFFLASLWIAFNPAFTPQRVDLGLPMLAFYYVWALVTGYGAGYFLWFKTSRPPRRPAKAPAIALAALIGIMPLLLLWKNLPGLRATNTPTLHELARQLYTDLPAGKSVALSEDSKQLLLLRAELAAHGRDKDPVLVETPALVWLDYHRSMARRYLARWPDILPTNRLEKIGPTNLLVLASQLAAREPVVYLHPSSGFFLERFRDEPNGLVHRLAECRPGEIIDPPLDSRLVLANEQIWQQRWSARLGALAEQFANLRASAARWSRPPLRNLRLARRPNATAEFLGAIYSKAFDHWGVAARRAGQESEATEWFRRSIAMNADNLAARINLEYATRSARGEHARLKLTWVREEFPETLGKYENWWEVLSQNGPVDEPTFLLQSGRVLLAVRNPRQAANAFARCAALTPGWAAPRLWQAQSYNTARQFTQALEITAAIDANRQILKGPGLAELILCRTMALRELGRTNDAAVYLEQFVKQHGDYVPVLTAAASLYAANAQFEQELKIREALSQRDPKNPELLAKQGLAELRLRRYETAIATLTQALNLAPTDSNARLLRAVALLQSGQLEASKADYRELLKKADSAQNALFGLGGIAWREHDTNAVLHYYQQFLSNNAAVTLQFNMAAERLRQLRDE